jgi:hypothetical protein
MIANAATTRGKGKAAGICAWSTPRFGRDSPPVGGIGLFAGGVSRAAVQGGLLTGLITRERAASAESTIRTGKQPADRAAHLARSIRQRSGPRWWIPGRQTRVADAARGTDGCSRWRRSCQSACVPRCISGPGLLIIVFGLAELGVAGLPPHCHRAPAVPGRRSCATGPALHRLWHRSARAGRGGHPVQVTLSVAALALTSGSDLSGGATMAMFVLGTSPLFALLGYAARRAATAWRGRLTVLTGLA